VNVSNPAYEPANPLQIINWICKSAQKHSTVGIQGVHGSTYDKFPLRQLFQRGLQISSENYNEQLLHLIETGDIDPVPLISHTMKLDKALKAYEMFDKKSDVTKVILKPQ
jgi:S-(hydroxymethyl)glutathione dehydrogenase / alcohol dehydrogenase